MAYTASIGAFICYLHTRLEQGQKKARHKIEVARIQLFIKTQEYEEARRKLERNLAACERNLAKISERITTVEEDRANWIDQAEYLEIVKSNLVEHPTKDAEWKDLFKQSDDELQDCHRNIAADDGILEALRLTGEVWRDKKTSQNDDLDRKTTNFERRRARWQAQIDQNLKDAEVFKEELAQVLEKVQGPT